MVITAIIGGIEIFLIVCIWTAIIALVIFLVQSLRNLGRSHRDIIANQQLEIELLQKLMDKVKSVKNENQ
jgi:hypothetical protein